MLDGPPAPVMADLFIKGCTPVSCSSSLFSATITAFSPWLTFRSLLVHAPSVLRCNASTARSPPQRCSDNMRWVLGELFRRVRRASAPHSFISFPVEFIRFLEYTECRRLAAILPILNTQAHLYRRGQDRSHTEAPTSVPENPPPPHPSAAIR